MSRYALWLVPAAFMLVGAGCFSLTGNSAQGSDGGVFQTTDGGSTWVQKTSVPSVNGVGSFATVNVVTLSGDPHFSGAVVAGTATEGILATDDNGVSWRKLGETGGGVVRALAFDPSVSCTLYASTGSRIVKSGDCGRSWKAAYDVSGGKDEVRVLAVAPDNGRLLYAGLSDGTLLVSKNAGESWAVANRFKSVIRSIAIDPRTASRLFIATERNGLWKSDDRGGTWKELREEQSAFAGSARGWLVRTDSAATVWYASTYGLLRSADAGATWQAVPLITAPGEARIYDVAVNPRDTQQVYYSAVVAGKALLYSTVDGGGNWQTKKLSSVRVPASIYINPANPQEVYLGMYQIQK